MYVQFRKYKCMEKPNSVKQPKNFNFRLLRTCSLFHVRVCE